MLLSFVAFIRQSVTHMFATTAKNKKKKATKISFTTSTIFPKNRKISTFPSFLILLIFDIDFLSQNFFTVFTIEYKCCCFVNPAVQRNFYFSIFYSRVVWRNKKHLLCFLLSYFSYWKWENIFSFSVSSHSYPDLSQARTHKQHNMYFNIITARKMCASTHFFISPPVIFICAIVNVSHAYLRWRTFVYYSF